MRLPLLLFLLAGKVTAQQVVPSDGIGAAFAQPLSTVTLRVSGTDKSGAPMAGVNVLFAAPTSGPSGEFTQGAGDTQIRVSTDENGIATTSFYPNTTLGPYLVSAWVEGTTASTTLAITNSASPPPILDPVTARQALNDQLKPASTTVVYGPFLMEAGSTISNSGGVSAAPIQLAFQSVFFWLDDNPSATFDHPVRWVTLDAANGNPTVQPINRSWAPYVVPTGSDAGYGLVAPLVRLGQSAILPADARKTVAIREALVSINRYGDGSNTQACAIIVYGPDAASFEISAAQMRAVFSDTLNIPDANILEDTTPGVVFGVNHQPSTPSRWRALFAKAKEKGCKKIYYYFAGHGYDGGFCLAKEPDSKSQGDYDNVDFTALATELQNTNIPTVYVVQQSCHSASAIAPLQGHGFDGEVLAAADLNGLAYHNPIPGFRECFWTGILAASWMKSGASVDPKILGEAVVTSLKNVDDIIYNNYVLSGNPRSAIIEAKGGQASAPQIVIVDLNDTAQNPASITITKPANFVPGDGSVEMFINDVTIARDPSNVDVPEPNQHNSRVTLNANANSGAFTIKGISEGSTPYTITFTDRDRKTYTATGTIIVGRGYTIAPNPVQVEPGGTATVKVTRGAALAKQSGTVTLTVKAADAASGQVATPGITTVIFPPGATSVDVPIKGLKAGTATLQVSDGSTTKSFQVNVAAVCPTGGVMNMNIRLMSDPFRSASFVMMPATAALPFTIVSGNLNLQSTVPQLPAGSGKFDASTCSTNIKTISTAAIAGFRGVHVEYDISFTNSGTAVSMVIREGTDSTLNNEPLPVTYTATGTVGK